MTYPEFLKLQSSLIPSQNVSRETFNLLKTYVECVLRANETFNLIGPKEKYRIWERHVIDSMQLFPHIENKGKVCDVGSGAGFPGIVLGILGLTNITLVESIKKKASFLQDVSHETFLKNKVLWDRVENLKEIFDVVTARGVASLEKIFNWTYHIRNANTSYVLLKGKTYNVEIEQALKKYQFDVKIFQSVTHLDGKILVIQNVH